MSAAGCAGDAQRKLRVCRSGPHVQLLPVITRAGGLGYPGLGVADAKCGSVSANSKKSKRVWRAVLVLKGDCSLVVDSLNPFFIACVLHSGHLRIKHHFKCKAENPTLPELSLCEAQAALGA